MKWRRAQAEDAAMLARMNAELIQDERHSNPMTVAQLEHRMRGWLSTEYSAILFMADAAIVAYALFRDNEGRGVLLRQFFVSRDHRRQGIGRQAFDVLLAEVLPPGTRVIVEVLSQNSSALAFWQAVGFTDYARTLEHNAAAR